MREISKGKKKVPKPPRIDERKPVFEKQQEMQSCQFASNNYYPTQNAYDYNIEGGDGVSKPQSRGNF